MKILAACLMLICTMAGICAAAELTGTVLSKAGQPLAGVTVISRCRGVAETNAAGSFRLRAPTLADCGKVVYFWAAGFLPQVKVVGEATEEIYAVLEESEDQGRLIQPCSDAYHAGRRLGAMLRVPVLGGASVEKIRGAHGSGWKIRVKSKQRRPELHGSFGQYAFSYPPDDLLLTAVEYTIRPWRSEREEGVDFRGRSADGTRWRYFAVAFGEEVQYSAVTDEEAVSLDSSVDGLCFQPLRNPSS